MAYPNPPKTWSAGAVLTAAQLNAELRDALNIIIPTASTTLAWASYTPTLTQSATVTKTVPYAKYFQMGKIVHANIQLAITGSGTASNAVTIGLPVTAVSATSTAIGAGWIFDSSAGTNYKGIVFQASTTTCQMIGTTGALGAAEFTAGLASPDTITLHIVYEAA